MFSRQNPQDFLTNQKWHVRERGGLPNWQPELRVVLPLTERAVEVAQVSEGNQEARPGHIKFKMPTWADLSHRH